MSKPACDQTHTKVVIIGVDLDDCRAYFQHARKTSAYAEEWTGWRALTPRTNQVHGWIGPVFATPAARLHPFFAALLQQARPCGILCTCSSVLGPERVA